MEPAGNLIAQVKDNKLECRDNRKTYNNTDIWIKKKDQ